MRDTYILEKAVGAIRDIAHLVVTLKNPAAGEAELRKAVETALHHSLWDLTKVASAASGADWDVSDRELIINDPKHGLEQLLKRYGWITETTRERECREMAAFLADVRPLLSNPSPAPNRTLLNEVLRHTSVTGPIIDHLLQRLELVHQGKLLWDEFRHSAISILNQSNRIADTDEGERQNAK
jgi:hypothetical protein